jgi:hypothetical protein
MLNERSVEPALATMRTVPAGPHGTCGRRSFARFQAIRTASRDPRAGHLRVARISVCGVGSECVLTPPNPDASSMLVCSASV